MFHALTGADEAMNSTNKPPKTAASLLLEQKKQMKERMDATATINFSIPKTDPTYSSPFLEQISKSTVEPPKYWNSGNTGLSTHFKHKNGQKASKAYSTASSHQNKPSVLEQKTKKALANINKGQDYHDRLQGKLSSKLSKQKMKNKLKG